MSHRALAGVLTLASFAAQFVCGSASATAEMPLKDGQRVLFLGDSITQNGRYVDLMEAYLWSVYPDREITVINAGLSSETVSGITEPVHPYPRPNIHDRLERALQLAAPDWVVVCYGMNDGIYRPVEPRIVKTYQDGLRSLVKKIHASGAQVILVTPPPFDPDVPTVRTRLAEASAEEPYGYRRPYEKYDETLERLSAVVRSMADRPGVERVIRLHEAVDAYLQQAKRHDPHYAYGDGVHPPVDGHLMIAVSLLQGLGEPKQQVLRRLAELTGLRPVGAAPQSLPADEQAAVYQRQLFQRGGELSAAYRAAIGSARAPAQSDPPLSAAVKVADQRRQALQTLAAEIVVDP